MNKKFILGLIIMIIILGITTLWYVNRTSNECEIAVKDGGVNTGINGEVLIKEYCEK